MTVAAAIFWPSLGKNKWNLRSMKGVCTYNKTTCSVPEFNVHDKGIGLRPYDSPWWLISLIQNFTISVTSDFAGQPVPIF